MLRNTQENFFMQEYLRNNDTVLRAGSKSVMSNLIANSATGSGREAEILGFKKPVVPNQKLEEQYRMKKKNAVSRIIAAKKRDSTEFVIQHRPRLDTQLLDPPETKGMTTPANGSDLHGSNENSPRVDDYSRITGGDIDTLRNTRHNEPYLLAGMKQDPRFLPKYGSAVTPAPTIGTMKP